MKSCCESKCSELEALREKQKNVLLYVLLINSFMFFVEFIAGLLANSTSLLADSLDMFGDATVYAFSLYVLSKNSKWKAKAALLKGVIILLFGFFILGDVTYKIISHELPTAQTMGWIGLMALLANGFCLFLLTKHKSDDINMKSTWICSRNDIIANTGVILAAGIVSLFKSKWPDIIIGLIIAIVFLRSAVFILKEAKQELTLSV